MIKNLKIIKLFINNSNPRRTYSTYSTFSSMSTRLNIEIVKNKIFYNKVLKRNMMTFLRNLKNQQLPKNQQLLKNQLPKNDQQEIHKCISLHSV